MMPVIRRSLVRGRSGRTGDCLLLRESSSNARTFFLLVFIVQNTTYELSGRRDPPPLREIVREIVSSISREKSSTTIGRSYSFARSFPLVSRSRPPAKTFFLRRRGRWVKFARVRLGVDERYVQSAFGWLREKKLLCTFSEMEWKYFVSFYTWIVMSIYINHGYENIFLTSRSRIKKENKLSFNVFFTFTTETLHFAK